VVAGFSHYCFHLDLSSVLSMCVLALVCSSVFDFLSPRGALAFCFVSCPVKNLLTSHVSCFISLDFITARSRFLLRVLVFCDAFVSAVTDRCSHRTSLVVVPTRRQQIHFPTHIFLVGPQIVPGCSVPRSCSFSGMIYSLVGSVVRSPLLRHENQFVVGVFSV
jgi:hypothetical protein